MINNNDNTVIITINTGIYIKSEGRDKRSDRAGRESESVHSDSYSKIMTSMLSPLHPSQLQKITQLYKIKLNII